MCVRDIVLPYIVLPWDRQVLGEWNHLFFFQKCSIQYPVLHNYYTA
jgi:hypothetical protein